jgi:hypothetical protein
MLVIKYGKGVPIWYYAVVDSSLGGTYLNFNFRHSFAERWASFFSANVAPF